MWIFYIDVSICFQTSILFNIFIYLSKCTKLGDFNPFKITYGYENNDGGLKPSWLIRTENR